MVRLAWVLGGAALLYLAVGLAMFVLQRSLMYLPDGKRYPPALAGLQGVTEVTLATPDSERLLAWHTPAPEGRPTILYFHGNGGGLADRAERIAELQARRLGVLMLSYRSYSGSTGRPSEQANVADALIAYDWLVGKGVAARDIVLMGESLGTGVAVQVALARPARALVLDSPYTTLADAAALHYPWLPVRWLVLDRYDSLSRIGRLKVPLLIVHGEADAVVPVEMGRELFAAAPEPKEILTYPGAGHLAHTGQGSLAAIADFIDRVAGR